MASCVHAHGLQYKHIYSMRVIKSANNNAVTYLWHSWAWANACYTKGFFLPILTDSLCLVHNIIPYLCKRGSMGGAPYIEPTLGDGPIIEVSVS